ncbi:hypothetical protein B0H16DRAFT_1459587 [Mycena metata]|uniref:Transmembrane protein n=1 Tax=Mycena metata TaxID=1033252 RepID=A0AAD7NAP5_9AGAR|nr:hypothetical protein B0H16DRAFT_1459587 [Mycena metata]
MLFWVFVFFLTRQSGRTQGHPNLLARAPTEASCDCTINNCRTLFDIVWGCLATIFACTWVALHQNVPDPDLGWFSLLMRKLHMMLSSKSRKHTGSFATWEDLCLKKVTQFQALSNFLPTFQPSKKPRNHRPCAMATPLETRASQHLPLTELEVATLAFAVLSVVIRLLWLHKPLDVQQPIVVARSEVDIDPLQEEGITPPSDSFTRGNKISSGFTGNYEEYSPLSSTSVPSFYSIDIDAEYLGPIENTAGVFGVATIFGSIHCAAWNALFPSMAEMWIWRISSVFIAAYPALTTLLIVLDAWAPSIDIAEAVFVFLFVFGLVVYPLCRLFLIILSFTTLRSLPPSAFVNVNWSNYIPHL